jgi:phage tail-like protein
MPYPTDIQHAFRAGPPLGFRFMVSFLMAGGIPNPLDIRFNKVSGLGANTETMDINEGGQNLYIQKLPKGIRYQNLVLERGMAVGSLLVAEFNAAMSLFKYKPCNVMVSLLDETGMPISTWVFMNAFPIAWSVSPFDADANAVVIETLELAYQRMQAIKL